MWSKVLETLSDTRVKGLFAILLVEILSVIAIGAAWGPLVAVGTAVVGTVIGVLTYRTTGPTPFLIWLAVLILIPIAGISGTYLTGRAFFAGALIAFSIFSIGTLVYGITSQ